MTVRSERRTKAGPLIKWYVLGPLTAAVSLRRSCTYAQCSSQGKCCRMG